MDDIWFNTKSAKYVHRVSGILVKLAHVSMYKNTDDPSNPYRIWLEGEYEKITRSKALKLLSKIK